jgi:hypothetical protein
MEQAKSHGEASLGRLHKAAAGMPEQLPLLKKKRPPDFHRAAVCLQAL